MSAKGLRACMFVGSARETRLADRVVKFMSGQMKLRGWELDTIDAAETNLPILKQPTHFYPNQDDVPVELKSLEEKVKAADAYVIVTCEYNCSLPPGLLNLIDHFAPASYAKKPSGIVCYSPGMYGGIRAGVQARGLLGEISTVSIPNIFGMPKVQTTLAEDGTPIDEQMIPRAVRHIEQLEWYTHALKNARDADK